MDYQQVLLLAMTMSSQLQLKLENLLCPSPCMKNLLCHTWNVSDIPNVGANGSVLDMLARLRKLTNPLSTNEATGDESESHDLVLSEEASDEEETDPDEPDEESDNNNDDNVGANGQAVD